MNEGRPFLQMWRGVWVSFCKIAIVSFLSVRYKSDGLYCRMAGTPSSPTLFFYKSRDTPINYILYFLYSVRITLTLKDGRWMKPIRQCRDGKFKHYWPLDIIYIPPDFATCTI